MLAVIEQHRLVLFCCCEIFVSVVAIVKEVKADLVEQQSAAKQGKDNNIQAAFLHTSKITIS